MSGSTQCTEPIASTSAERLSFARLVRQGFPAAQDLERRIRAARWLAFHYEADDTLAAVAALKAPPARHRKDIFAKADATASAADYDIELGWIYVAPAYRGNRT